MATPIGNTQLTLELFLPDLPGLLLQKILLVGNTLRLTLWTTQPSVTCPKCQTPSINLHSYYTRSVSDLPFGDLALQLELRVRRFYCYNAKCSCRTFSENLSPLVPRYAQRTNRKTLKLRQLGLALGGESGARTAARLDIKTSPDTLLRIIRATTLQNLPKPILTPPPPLRVIGLDDWSYRRNKRYGTIIIDLERHTIVELLPDRESATVARFLAQHPSIEIVSRDGSMTYADAIRTGAPQAEQVSDRFHLVKHLREVAEQIVREAYSSLKEWWKEHGPGQSPTPPPSAIPEAKVVERPQPRDQNGRTGLSIEQPALPLSKREASKKQTLENRRERYFEIHKLKEEGYTKVQISEQTGVSPDTVAKYLQAKKPPEPKPPLPEQSPSKLDPYKAYLKKRHLDENVWQGKQLLGEIRGQGYTGCYSVLSKYLARLRHQAGWIELSHKKLGQDYGELPLPKAQALSSPRNLSRLLISREEELKAEDKLKLEALLQAKPLLKVARELVLKFEGMIHEHSAEGLTEWLEAMEQSGFEQLKNYAAGIRRDEKAVRNGLTMRWSQGQAEGSVNKLKLVKRSMYGRAGFGLLRIRVLFSP